LDKRLLPFKKKGKVTAKLTTGGGRSCLTVVLNAAKDSASARNLESALIDTLSDVVITDFKFHFIKSSLNLPIDDEISRHAFIRALSNFDRAVDKHIAKSLLKLSPDFLLDSFYVFSIDSLKVRWQEVCALANENARFLVCDGTFRELLRFLISNLESRCAEVHLFQRHGGVDVLTSALKPINVYAGDELSADAQVVSKLIAIAPKRIFLHQNINPSTQEFICNLFGNCVQVVQN
jgi:hypothetical protein